MIRSAINQPDLPVRDALHYYTNLCLSSIISYQALNLLRQYDDFKRFNIQLNWTEFNHSFPDYLYEAFCQIDSEHRYYEYLDRNKK